jgi:hypothetical protein
MMRNLIFAGACSVRLSMTNDAATPVTVTTPAVTIVGDTNCATTQAAFQAAHGLAAPTQAASVTPDAATLKAIGVEALQNLMSEIQRIQAAQIATMTLQ